MARWIPRCAASGRRVASACSRARWSVLAADARASAASRCDVSCNVATRLSTSSTRPAAAVYSSVPTPTADERRAKSGSRSARPRSDCMTSAPRRTPSTDATQPGECAHLSAADRALGLPDDDGSLLRGAALEIAQHDDFLLERRELRDRRPQPAHLVTGARELLRPGRLARMRERIFVARLRTFAAHPVGDHVARDRVEEGEEGPARLEPRHRDERPMEYFAGHVFSLGVDAQPEVGIAG